LFESRSFYELWLSVFRYRARVRAFVAESRPVSVFVADQLQPSGLVSDHSPPGGNAWITASVRSVRASSCRIFPRDVNAADPRLAMPRTAEPMPISSSASLLSIICAYLSSPVQQAVPDGGDAVTDRDARRGLRLNPPGQVPDWQRTSAHDSTRTHEPCHTSLLTSWFMVTKGHWAGIDPMSPSADADR